MWDSLPFLLMWHTIHMAHQLKVAAITLCFSHQLFQKVNMRKVENFSSGSILTTQIDRDSPGFWIGITLNPSRRQWSGSFWHQEHRLSNWAASPVWQPFTPYTRDAINHSPGGTPPGYLCTEQWMLVPAAPWNISASSTDSNLYRLLNLCESVCRCHKFPNMAEHGDPFVNAGAQETFNQNCSCALSSLTRL